VTTPTEQRERALAASEGGCPRCGAPREPDQAYCVECGLRLPVVTGRLPAMRRRWIRRFGWYPGDWIWVSLLTLAVAAAGAAAAIAITHPRREAAGRTVVASTVLGLGVARPTTAAAPTSTARAGTTTAAAKRPRNGTGSWPAATNGWTIVLSSYPAANGRDAARQTAARAAHAGLPRVGLLESGDYPSLQPGYIVVFTGVYGSESRAESALTTAHAAGFAGAYVRQVAR
jgi:hypothetical protein